MRGTGVDLRTGMIRVPLSVLIGVGFEALFERNRDSENSSECVEPNPR